MYEGVHVELTASWGCLTNSFQVGNQYVECIDFRTHSIDSYCEVRACGVGVADGDSIASGHGGLPLTHYSSQRGSWLKKKPITPL